MGKRTEGLDLLKLICAFLVLAAHRQFPKPIGPYLTVLARLTVPIFCMITGYFSLSRVSAADGHTRFVYRGGYKNLWKVLKLVLLSNGLYLLIGICDHLSDGKLEKYLDSVLGPIALQRTLIYNSSPIAKQLWYLHALLYAVFVIVTMDKLKLRKVLYALTPFLVIGDFVLGHYSIFVFGKVFPVRYTRNWLFFVLPNLCAGMMLKEYDIVERTRKYHRLMVLASILFTVGSLLEYRMFRHIIKSDVRANYVCTVIAAVFIFISFAQIEALPGRFLKFLAKLGREASLGIYIIHIYFVDHLAPFFNRIGLRAFFKSCAPLVVFTLSTIVVCLYNAIKRRLTRRRASTSNP